MISGTLLTRISLGVCLVSLVFQIVGITCPGWLLVTVNLAVVDHYSANSLTSVGGEVETMSSVWYVRICLNGIDGNTGQECTSYSPHNPRYMGFKLTNALTELGHLDWTEVKIELTTASVFCMTGIIIVVIMVFCDPSRLVRRLLTGVSSGCMILSGILILPAVIKVGLSVQNTKKTLSNLGHENDFVRVQTSWALILSVLGLVIAFVSAALLIIAEIIHKEGSTVVTPHIITKLAPFDMRLAKFPFAVANITESDLEGHLPPKLNNRTPSGGGGSGIPRIGAKDDEPLAFQNVALTREDTMFNPFVRFPNKGEESQSDDEAINEAENDEQSHVKNIPGQLHM